MVKKLRALFKDERGEDMIEYALLSSLIAVALIIIIGQVADAVEDLFQSVVDAF